MVTLEEFGGWRALIGELIAGRDLTSAQTGAALADILTGDATAAQIAGFLVALRAKGETAEELAGLLSVAMAEAAIVPLTEVEREVCVDVVGTGGDGSHSINVSTMAAIVTAAAGGPVCKHGGRSASSTTGTADVLEHLGVAVELSPDGVARCVREVGIGFCFAPAFHPAFRYAGAPRREMGVPTVFNLLGPMANPGRVKRQLIGVADPSFARPMVEALAATGLTAAWVVHGGGLDELTTTGPSSVLALTNGVIDEFTIDPQSLGFKRATADDLRGGGPDENAEAVRRVFAGDLGRHRDIVVLNAGAALVVAARADDIEQGIVLAAAAIDDGRAATTLQRMIDVSQDAAADA